MRHNKKRNEERGRLDIPEIFKDLWGYNFVEDIGFSKVKNEIWPKIRITVSAGDEEKKKGSIKTVLGKYEFPFSNVKIVSSSETKEQKTDKEKADIKASGGFGNRAGNGKLLPVDHHSFKFKAR